jgi:hypothetical protein
MSQPAVAHLNHLADADGEFDHLYASSSV